MVSARQVVATPIRAGRYSLARLAKARRRLPRPPKTADSSVKLELAASKGSRKCEIA
jgi:hypothetical protein